MVRVCCADDLFTATKGRGAFMNERRIRVSKRTDMRQCLISTGFPFRPGDNHLLLGEAAGLGPCDLTRTEVVGLSIAKARSQEFPS